MKKIILLLAIMLITISSIFAVNVNINWQWTPNDRDVEFFRYQINSEDEAGWTVVDSSVNSFELTDVSRDVEYTLYIQQSYDGIYWSNSKAALSVEKPLPLPVEIAPIVISEPEKEVEEPIMKDSIVEELIIEPSAEEVVEITPIVPVDVEPAEEKIIDEVVEEKRERGSQSVLNFAAGLNNNIINTSYVPGFNLAFSFAQENIADSGFGLKLTAGASLAPVGTWPNGFFSLASYDKELYASVYPLYYSVYAGDHTVNFGAGGEFTFGKSTGLVALGKIPSSFNLLFNSDLTVYFNPSIEIGYRYNFSPVCGIGLDLNLAYLGDLNFTPQAKTSLSFTF